MKVITAQQLKDFANRLELDDTIQISRGTAGDYLFSTVSLLTLSPTEENVYCVECGAESELECICDDLNHAPEVCSACNRI